MSHPMVTIMSREGALYVLERPHPFTHVISICPPLKKRRAGQLRYEEPDLASVPGGRLRLRFDDEVEPTEGRTLPSASHIRQLIRFADTIAQASGHTHLLAHCHAGLSRSTAAAFIVLATVLGPGHEHDAFTKMLAAQSQASPNRLMVQLADKILRREGRLIAELEDYRDRRRYAGYTSDRGGS